MNLTPAAFFAWREANPDAGVNDAWHAALEHASARITALEAREAALVKAMTPSADTKADYMGEFSFEIDESFFDEESECFDVVKRKVFVPWDTVKEIMSAIKARALSAQEGK